MDNQMEKGAYITFMVMLGISFFIMYAVMFFNVAEFGHIYLSTTRFYMTLLMVTPMALLMLTLMRKMFTDKKLNIIIIISSLLVFTLSFILLRTQTPIEDKQYMKALIPHHSSAILVSKQANIKDPEVKELAQKIIESQEKEIAQMEAILEKMDIAE